jgi:hypothetical protein
MQPRFQAVEGAFAFPTYAGMVVGQILDINEHGLSFRYIASQQKVDGYIMIDIIVRGFNFRCPSLTCKTIWDRAEPKNSSLGHFNVRVCGIQFGTLTEAQKSCLKTFIQQYTDPQ